MFAYPLLSTKFHEDLAFEKKHQSVRIRPCLYQLLFISYQNLL
jgi:hypothetical protein